MKNFYFNYIAIGMILFCMGVRAQTVNSKITVFHPYRFIYISQDSLYIKKLYQKIEPAMADLDKFFGQKTSAVITIRVTRSQSEYTEASLHSIPEWSQALAVPADRLIILKISGAEDILNSPQILLHELVHIRIDEFCGGQPVPVWLNEGLAQYLSAGSLNLNQKLILAQAIHSKAVLDLSAIDTLMNFRKPQAELAYAQTLSVIEYILEHHGKSALLSILQGYSQQLPGDEILKTVLGYDFIDLEIFWYEYIYGEYRWLILINFDNFLWLAIILLILAAIIAVRIRNRMKLKKWDLEESLQTRKESE